MQIKSSSLCFCLGIFLLTFAFFHVSLDNEFVNWDDPMFIYENPRIQKLDWPHFRDFFTSFEAGAYTPLSQLSLAVDWAIWGNNSAGFHLTGLLLHCLNACLVFLIAGRLIQAAGSRFDPPWPRLWGTRLQAGPLFAALLFSLHPMRVESVAWACERRDVLSGFFSLACTLAYLRYGERVSSRNSVTLSSPGQDRNPFGWYLFTFLLFICAVISKPVAILLPLVFLLLDVHPCRRISQVGINTQDSGLVRPLWEKIPLFLVSIVTGLILMTTLLQSDLALRTHQTGWESRIAQSLVANMLYLSMIFFPLHLNPLNNLRSAFHFDQPVVWAGLAFNGIITLIFIWKRRRFPSTLIAWFSYGIMIAPFLGFAASGLQLTADRYTYLASVPLCILLGGVLSFGFRKIQPWLCNLIWVLCPVLLLGWLGWRTYQQTQVWNDSESLWKHCLRLERRNPVAWNNLGETVAVHGKTAEAIHCFEQAVHFAPDYFEGWCNLGTELNESGRYPEAIEACQKSLNGNPFYAPAHSTLGGTYAHLKNLTAALQHYQRSQLLAPSPVTEYNIAWCFALKGDTQSALQYLPSAAGQGIVEAWLLWSDLMARHGEKGVAINLLKEGVQRTGNLRVQLALVEMILAQPRPSTKDLLIARKILLELDSKPGRRNETVRTLLLRLYDLENSKF